MELEISGTPNEIAALVLELQKRQRTINIWQSVANPIQNATGFKNNITNDAGAHHDSPNDCTS